MRASRAMARSSAFEEMARLKAAGKKRREDYDIVEEANVYEEVDEETYRAIDAERRREAREFVELEDDEDGSEFEEFLEAEFEYEDEESRFRSKSEISKRKREERRRQRMMEGGGTGIGTKPIQTAPMRRVNAAFFGGANGAGADPMADDDDRDPDLARKLASAPKVLDSLLETENLDAEIEVEKHRRRVKFAHREWETYGELHDDEEAHFDFKRRGENGLRSGRNELDYAESLAPPPPRSRKHAQFQDAAMRIAAERESIFDLETYSTPPPSAAAATTREQHAEMEIRARDDDDPLIHTAGATPHAPQRPGTVSGGSVTGSVPAATTNAKVNARPAAPSLAGVSPVAASFFTGASVPLSSASLQKNGANAAEPSAAKTPSGPPEDVLACLKHLGGAGGSSSMPAPFPAGNINGKATRVQTATPKIESAAAHEPEWEQLARTRKGELLLYWYDAHEERSSSSGTEDTFLFCKAVLGTLHKPRGYVNVTLHVQGLDRVVYFLPRFVDEQGKGESKGVSSEGERERVPCVPNVFQEVSHILQTECNAPRFMAKAVSRRMPFGDHDAPAGEAEYLKVKYPYAHASLPVTKQGKTFARVFGTRTTSLERLLVKRGLMGPGWIRVADAALTTRLATTRFVVVAPEPKCINEVRGNDAVDPPPVTVLSIGMKTELGHTKASANQPEIVMLSGIMMHNVSMQNAMSVSAVDTQAAQKPAFVALRQLSNTMPLPMSIKEQAQSGASNLHVMPNEQALLNFFLASVMRLDPDVIVGHDMLGSTLETLLARLAWHKIRDWSRLGRLRQKKDVAMLAKSRTGYLAFAGRLVVDTLVCSKELCPREKDYMLPSLADSILKRKVHPRTEPLMTAAAYENERTLSLLIAECIQDAALAMCLVAELSVIPLTRQLTNLSGNIWSRTMRAGARAERIEFLLCHEFNRSRPKLVLPDKLYKSDKKLFEDTGINQKPKRLNTTDELPAELEQPAGVGVALSMSKRRKPQYSGGLVLEPKRGLYDRYVLQLDFNSLYPSIIQEYNICFTTLNLQRMYEAEGEGDYDTMMLERGGVTSTTELGILPRVLTRLVEQRRQVKKVLKEERDLVRYKQLDIRQLAIKLTANSLYGCLGFEGSRFYARPLAELITLQGRSTLQKTVDLAQNTFSLEVIYGDTDSLFIYTGLNDIKQVQRLGMELKVEVNKKYRALEIEIDAVYAKMLLLRKKKYAALKVPSLADPGTTVREVKGLDMVRHDWSGISFAVSDFTLSQLLSMEVGTEEAVSNVLIFLEQTAENLRANRVPLQQYVITKSLTKNPEEYPDGLNLPHVQVALRRKKNGLNARPGDFIQYVICRPMAAELGPSNASTRNEQPFKDSIALRAYHPDEVNAAGGALEIDTEYYVTHQILPPIGRLFEPIEGIDTARIASALGLDPMRYAGKGGSGGSGAGGGDMDDALDVDTADVDATTRFQNCEPICVQCVACAHANELNAASELRCKQCMREFPEAYLKNVIHLHVRKWTAAYYCAPNVVESESGNSQTRSHDIELKTDGESAERANGRGERWLYSQLRYVSSIIDSAIRQLERDADNAAAAEQNGSGERVSLSVMQKRAARTLALQGVREAVQRYLAMNAYHFLDIGAVFDSMGLASMLRIQPPAQQTP
ncbi:DNA polymerase alpha catalytic subunit [Porphyridium purpureum]|uniref:DNA polymerase n=1 Tax=Porphyridium purpureum TaxID=35688 RepID=A0A5J4YJ02_PORPP|nr:DNA polymerase alpha catalytic subunit [Porphyridium purpureum]|eukprot:POR7036..scf270_19